MVLRRQWSGTGKIFGSSRIVRDWEKGRLREKDTVEKVNIIGFWKELEHIKTFGFINYHSALDWRFLSYRSVFRKKKLSLTDQIRRSSRSVSGNLAEAWRKRRYEKAFVAKLSDAEGEAAETGYGWIMALPADTLMKKNMMSSSENITAYSE